MIAVRTVGESGKFSQNFCAALLCILFCLYHQRAPSFADDKAISVSVKRTAGALWIVIICRKRVRRRQTENEQRCKRRLRSHRQYRICLSGKEQHTSGADSVSAGRTCRTHSQARPSISFGNRHLSGRLIANNFRNKTRTYFLVLPFTDTVLRL